jgi:DNA repair exonuclease SbcCD ATPase subunit
MGTFESLFEETPTAPAAPVAAPAAEPLSIHRLRIENYLGIEELDVAPGKVNVISGGNAQGKTSILDAIAGALSGEKARPRLVRDGADKAVVLLEVRDGEHTLQVKRTIGTTSSRLEVTDERGTVRSPQAFLAELFGTPDVFEPVKWLAKPDKEQAQDLLRLLPLSIGQDRYAQLCGGRLVQGIAYDGHPLVVLKQIEAALYEERRGLNADAKAAKAAVAELRDGIPAGFDAETVRAADLGEIFGTLRDCQDHNARVADEHRRRNLLTARISDLEQQLKAAQDELKTLDEWLGENGIADTEQLEAVIRTFEENKRMLAAYDQAAEAEARAGKLGAHADELTKLLDGIRAEPARLLREAQSPVEGLGVDEAGAVTINGRPLGNLSDGEKVRLALQVAQARSGRAQLMLVDGLEQLDTDVRAEFLRQAAEGDGQLLVTVVSEGELSWTTMDGQIADPFADC